MTNFANDLIRALDCIESPLSEDYGDGPIARDFFMWSGNHWDTSEPYDDTPEEWKNMNVSFTCVDSYGGEGMGDEYWSVYKFTDNNTGEEVYVKFDGWYASYEGATYGNCFVVQPKEKTITVYE